MNKLYNLILASLLFATLVGCNNASINPASDPAPVVAVTTQTSAIHGKPVSLKVVFTVQSSSGIFGHFADETDDTGRIITVYPVYVDSGLPQQAIIKKEVYYTFTPSQPGNFTLRFWSGSDKYITQTIEVK